MIESDVRLIFDKLVDYAYDNKWHLYVAKGGQRQSSLLAHSLTVADLAISLLDFVDKTNLKQNARKRLLIAAFFHDCFKPSEHFQKAITHEGGSDFTHIEPEEFAKLLRNNKELMASLGLTSDDIESIVAIYAFHGKISESAIHFLGSIRSGVYGDEEFLARILTLADGLASKKTVHEVRNLKVNGLLGNNTFEYHEVAIIRGVLTQILHSTIEDEAKSLGLTPILWYPEGTVYIGQHDLSLDVDKVKKNFEDKVRKFIDENANETQVVSAVFGGIGQRIIKSPEILFSSDKAIKVFLEHIVKEKFAKPSNLQKNPEEAVFNLLLITKGIANALCEETGLDDKEVIQKLKDMVIDPMNLRFNVSQLKKIAHTLPSSEKQEVLKTIGSAIKSYQNPSDFVEKLYSCMLNFGTWCRTQYISNVKNDLIKVVSEFIVSEISHPFIFSKNYPEASYKAYTDGKSKGTPICVFCGNKAEKELVASLVEKGGSETFINFLVGGSKIGSGNKAMVCKVCDLELKLRSLLAKGYSVFFLFPQFSVSRNTFMIASEELVKEKSPIDLGALSKEIARNGVSVIRPFKLKELVSLKEEKALILRRIEEFIEENEDVKHYLIGDFSKEDLKKMDNRQIAEALISGRLKIRNEELNKKLADELSLFRYSYPTGNYILFTVGIHKDKYDTDDTFLIRKIYLSLVLFLIFQSVVYIQETNEIEVLIFDEIHGVVKYPSSLGIRDIERFFGWRNGWVPISLSIEKSIEKLSSAFQVEEYFQKSQQGKKGLLLEVMREPAGKILNKYISNVKKFSPELVRLLDKLAQEADSHQQIGDKRR
ncbi:MAG: HD domain-containing protein [Brevinematia bacterium]|jgi:hypothetical protein